MATEMDPIMAAIRNARRESGRTQENVAGALGMKPTRLGMYEAGLRIPNLTLARRLAQEVGYADLALIGEYGPPSAVKPLTLVVDQVNGRLLVRVVDR